MAFVTPTDVTVGSVLTASKYNQEVVENGLAGQPIFTNEAARDAAIPSPYEGQRVYLTAPTVPTAAGGDTAIPTGVTTIYNGSVWVCTTPVGSRTDASGQTNSASYTTTLSGSPGTNPSVTLVTGTSALVSITCNISTTAVVSIMSFAVSGATTLAANDAFSVEAPSSVTTSVGRTLVLTGLTGGTNTFTLQYKSVSAATGTFVRRNIVVQGVA